MGDMEFMVTWGCMVRVRWGRDPRVLGPHGIGSQRDGGRQSQGVTGSCRGIVPPKLLVSAAMGSRTYRAMRSSWVMAHVV